MYKRKPPKNRNITDADRAMIREVQKLLLASLAIPLGPLEHVVQVAHESPPSRRANPPEYFEQEGVTRQALRMFWHFRYSLEPAMPREPTDEHNGGDSAGTA